ncbi:phage tail protein [Pseudomonas sp. 10S4]|uniref:phage tail protein n=1 Tax=Pseudomonas sp. 10S4 TaxID=3048583 RepID=UPI002AC921C8|nr:MULTISPECIES: phage tail protein [unclassified Pseudomonas]MEB0226255.1 phage tail protein [Pseudomonas sp. 5S1]MEB0294924.1 phage tail protein [Pseudomonas sp. 10S4]WPX18132.1 phage tail protein [Pseudomonas sp. 10S4]
MGYKIPNGGKFQHAATYEVALPFTAISNASEAVASVVGADFDAGDIVLLSSGWSQLDNKVVRVKSATASAVTLEAIDTTDTQIFPAGNGAGTMRKVLTWVQIPQVTDLAFSGGEQNYLDVVFLEDDQGKQMPTDKSAASMVLTIADDPTQAFNAVLLKADAGKQVQAARLNLPGNDMLLYGAYTSFSKQPAVSRNNLLTRTVNLALQSEPTRYLSVV